MVFGFSWGEVALIVGASAALFGPKDIVIIGRVAGRLTGKAVGYIQSFRGHIDPILQRSEINTVHKELRETMAQLEAIRHEMRTGISIMNPGSLRSQVLENALPGLSAPIQSSEKGAENRPDLSKRAPVNQVNVGVSNQVSPTQILMQMQNLQAASNQEKPAGNVTLGSTGFVPPPAEGTPVGLASVIKVSQEFKHPDGRAPGQELLVLPISAVEAGLLPSNQEPISGGADIVFASIVERKVAFQSSKFLMDGKT